MPCRALLILLSPTNAQKPLHRRFYPGHIINLPPRYPLSKLNPQVHGIGQSCLGRLNSATTGRNQSRVEPHFRSAPQNKAMRSISTRASRGRRATSTVERAGGCALK